MEKKKTTDKSNLVNIYVRKKKLFVQGHLPDFIPNTVLKVYYIHDK